MNTPTYTVENSWWLTHAIVTQSVRAALGSVLAPIIYSPPTNSLVVNDSQLKSS